MVRKIKVKVQTEEKNINLPAIPLSWLPFFLKIGIRSQKKAIQTHSNSEVPVDMTKQLELVQHFLDAAKPAMKDLAPFTLVEVETDDAYVFIEMR